MTTEEAREMLTTLVNVCRRTSDVDVKSTALPIAEKLLATVPPAPPTIAEKIADEGFRKTAAFQKTGDAGEATVVTTNVPPADAEKTEEDKPEDKEKENA